MPKFKRISVIPNLPTNLEPLREMAFNLWFSWEPNAVALFHELDPELWEVCYHNPVRLLQRVRQARLQEVSEDDGFLRRLEAVFFNFKAYLNSKETWYELNRSGKMSGPIAYFSAEFGFHESLPVYSGGLGILAGDHCKAASDLGLPFYGIGLLYREGYFRQRLNKDGWQEAEAMNLEFNELPIHEVRTAEGNLLTVYVEILGRQVHLRVWEVRVGRIKVLLLDTDLPNNSQEDRRITAELYGGDHDMRVRQEMILGIGGTRALRAMGIKPSVYHMNEGHAAFLGIERIRQIMEEQKTTFYPALQVVAASSIFTTHTPVEAGNDAFAVELMHRYFDSFIAGLKIGFDEFLRFGRPWNHEPSDPFSMTILALRMSRRSNGVSALHGEVSRGMWNKVWPNAPRTEVPISHVTNGIHLHTWLAPEMRDLYEKYFGPGWQENISDPDLWRRVSDIPDEELWEVHMYLKRRLVDFVRERTRDHRMRLGETPDRLRDAMHLLDPEILTIGFARRFATYKRALLLFQDVDTLKQLINRADRPVQIVLAGKAHPKDEGGKKLIQRIKEIITDPACNNRIVFIEDYDTNVARHLVQGVDVWLNNPLRPLEASGTSGQKVPPNGGINLSVLDGWWDEGYNGKNGWAIGADIRGGPQSLQDEVDYKSLYAILDRQVVPLYYAKPDGRLPLAWINLMRESIRSVSPVYNTRRMVREYTERFYIPASLKGDHLMKDGLKEALILAEWKNSIRKSWDRVDVQEVTGEQPKQFEYAVGEKIPVRAKVYLGTIKPEHVLVEAYFGELHGEELSHDSTIRLEQAEKDGDGTYWYKGTIEPSESGAYGYNVRVIPSHPNLTQKQELRLVKWGHV